MKFLQHSIFAPTLEVKLGLEAELGALSAHGVQAQHLGCGEGAVVDADVVQLWSRF